MSQDVDFSKCYELWLCDDCMIVDANGDYSIFDGSYEPGEAEQRIREVDAGFDALSKQGCLANDYSYDTQRECACCGHIGVESDFDHTSETEDTDEQWLCPKCTSPDTNRRDDGHDEFSRRDCDCCGSDLGGSRTRYSLFPFIKEPA